MNSTPKRILIFRIGSIGDTVVALPAISSIRMAFPDSRLTMLHDASPNGRLNPARRVTEAAGLIDDYLTFIPLKMIQGRVQRLKALVLLWISLVRGRFDLLVYLAPSARPSVDVARDRRFFRAAGIRRIWGMEALQNGGETRRLHEADALLGRLAHAGIAVPEAGQATFPELHVAADRSRFGCVQTECLRVGICIGGKKPVTRWPVERYREVARRLKSERGAELLFFGGPEDGLAVQGIIKEIGCGEDLTGAAALEDQLALMRSCDLFLSNDTGSIHLAAAVGVPCLGVYHAALPEGQWSPYGGGHVVIRRRLACENCGLFECIERKSVCITDIAVEEVWQACLKLLDGDSSGEVRR